MEPLVTSSQPEAPSPVRIDMDGVSLPGYLFMPTLQPKGLVLFAHGSGSGRHSPRNQFVARSLVDQGIAALLMDLLTEGEAGQRRNVFDIDLLAERLRRAVEWAAVQPALAHLKVGLFGASTGAGAALRAAARAPQMIRAVVSRGGRPDLALADLANVQAPTLLIVGGEDDIVIELNRQAMRRMTTVTEMVVIPGATHLFEEPGALEEVAELARRWFYHHLTGPSES